MFDIIGHQCIRCGSSENLEIHHVDPTQKQFDLTPEFSRPWKEIQAELKKCQPLCNTCHVNEHRSTHGSLGMYSHYKCRCQLCKDSWNAHHREYKRRYRLMAKALVL